MKNIIYENYGGLGLIIVAGIIILTLFVIIRFFKSIFSSAIVGFLLSLVSYFVYDFTIYNIPVIAALAFIISVTGYTKGLIKSLFALIGTLLSAYILLHSFGII